MPLAETDQQSQPDHPSQMPLAEANQLIILVIHSDAISQS
jgi:hypothetical protein